MALFDKIKKGLNSIQPASDLPTEEHAIINDLENAQERLFYLETEIKKRSEELKNINGGLQQSKKLLDEVNANIDILDFGLYEPKYNFLTSDEYKEKIKEIREKEKDMVKNNVAITGNKEWNVNGDRKAGAKMVKDLQKLLLRAFNFECDDIINKVKYSNFEPSKKRIIKSRETISKLGAMMQLSIGYDYTDLKIQELHLAYEYAQKKQEEKEAIRAAKAEMREAEKLQKEIDEQRKVAEKEQAHYKQALNSILKQIQESDNVSDDLISKKQELQDRLDKIDEKIADLDYRETNKKAGYVYVISNIGSFDLSTVIVP